MKVVNDDLLAEFRARGVCELCELWRPTSPHHVFARGMGGGGRLDIRVNLIALCWLCHGAVHSGAVDRDTVLRVVAARERTRPGAIIALIHKLRRS